MAPLRYQIDNGRQVVTLPLRINANFRGHTRSKARRHEVREQRGNARLFLQAKARKPKLPCTIKLVRLAPRSLDEDDNLRTAFKAVKDGICDWLGIDDRKGCPVTWEYDQQRVEPHTYGCRVVIGGAS